ncbi:Endo-beta-mannanase [Terricaulis silvestris]|uniref:Endo-beta-mannanase n=2 Tax=Terricaulis silvestris TaxID=2686094 RepID=A0A6I6MIJ2_9CAUL|nr:Endo-beta-mannanase [Terricaulis silvestris]
MAASGSGSPPSGIVGPSTQASADICIQNTDWGRIRGFNYHPSYATNLIEIWDRFDPAIIAIELARGKQYFPSINALRWWLSWDAFLRDPSAFLEKVRDIIALSEAIGCRVMPVLFNRTHLPPLDFGSIYIDHFLPGSFLNQEGMFNDYIDSLVGEFAGDPRILAWDLCNEPFWYADRPMQKRDGTMFPGVHHSIADAEASWLSSIFERCKRQQPSAPLTVGAWANASLHRVNDYSDVLSMHCYYNPGEESAAQTSVDQSAFEQSLDDSLAFAKKVGKPLFVTECCWGNLNDAMRVRRAGVELAQLSRRGLGFMAYVMHHSRMPDSHGRDGGPVGMPQDLSFIDANGRLRPGHEFFNAF